MRATRVRQVFQRAEHVNLLLLCDHYYARAKTILSRPIKRNGKKRKQKRNKSFTNTENLMTNEDPPSAVFQPSESPIVEPCPRTFPDASFCTMLWSVNGRGRMKMYC